MCLGEFDIVLCIDYGEATGVSVSLSVYVARLFVNLIVRFSTDRRIPIIQELRKNG